LVIFIVGSPVVFIEQSLPKHLVADNVQIKLLYGFITVCI
jgi:hypothetical protein